MGSWWPLKPKVKAAIVAAILTYAITRFGLDVGKQEANLINAAAPVIVGYVWDDNWDWIPKRKIAAAFLSAVVVFVLFKWPAAQDLLRDLLQPFGVKPNKFISAAANAVVPIIFAYLVSNPDPDNSEQVIGQ